ncbi:MAG: hypothetical protein QXF25_01120 [Candidatus Pacearchaeota archaeon]
MAEVHELQKKVLSLQNSDEINSIFARMISGKEDYKTIIEMKKEPLKCKKCNNLLYGDEKFCPECGTKVEKEAKTN